jgi:hypothetical protein
MLAVVTAAAQDFDRMEKIHSHYHHLLQA